MAMNRAAHGVMLQFLSWLSERPRTYGEAMETWRSSCPRYTVWEVALADGLIEVEKSNPVREAVVTLTDRGKIVLNRRIS
jgi:hypothetical protein